MIVYFFDHKRSLDIHHIYTYAQKGKMILELWLKHACDINNINCTSFTAPDALFYNCCLTTDEIIENSKVNTHVEEAIN